MAIKTGYVPYPACVVPADRVTGLTYSNYGMVHAKDIIGSRSVPDLPTLYQLSAGLLSEDGEGANAVGQLWYVASEKAYYTLTDWSKKDTSAGWTKGIPGVSGESSGGSIVDTNTTYAFNSTTKDNTIGFRVTPSEGDPTTVELGTFATINNKSILGGGNITIPTGPSVSVSPITNTGTNIANITIGNKTYSLFAPSATGGSAVDTNTTYTFGDGKVDNNTISIPITEKNIGGNPANKDITIGTFATINSKSILGGGNITTPDTNTTYSIGAAKTTDENTIGVTLTGSDGNNTDTSWGFKTINGNPVIGSGDINIPTGSSISITRSLTEGTPIATITLDGDAIVLYAPKATTSGGTAVDTNTTYAFNSATKDNTIGFRVIPSEGNPIPVSLGTLATINGKPILDGGNISTPDTNTTYSIGAAKTTDDNTIKVTLTGSDKVTSSASWEFRTINKNSIIGSGNITIPDTNTTYSIGAAKTTDENTIGVTLTDSNNVASSVGWEFKTINGNSVIGSGNIAISTPDQVVKKVENTGSGTVVESVKLSNGTLTVTNRAESPITITDAGPTEIATVGDVNVLTAIKASGHAITKTSRTIVLPGAIPDKDITNIIAPTAAASYGFHEGPASDLKPMCVTPCSPVIYKITKGSSTMKEGEYYLLDTSNGYFYECWSPGINGANAIRQGDRIDRTTSDSSLTSELAFMVVGDPTLGNPVKLVKLY